MEQGKRRLTLKRSGAAAPAAVYDLLADLRSHLDWGGRRQIPTFRLRTLDAPEGPATVGTVFTSRGEIPMSWQRWEDRSTVTIAARPSTFEFVTDARARGFGREMATRLVHRYDIAPSDGGSLVTYTVTEQRVSDPMLRFAIPGLRDITWWMARPMFANGLRNLIRAASRADASRVSAPTQRRKEA